MAVGSMVLMAIALIVVLLIVLVPGTATTTRLIILLVWAALFPALGIYCWVWPAVSYRHTSYCLKEDCLIIRTGVFWKLETVVPKSRIQHTDITQGPLQRLYEISELVIHTAGTRHALVALSGLPQRLAPQLRNHLLDRSDHATL